MELQEILAILDAVRDTGASELDLEKGDFKLRVRHEKAVVMTAAPVAAAPVAVAPAPQPAAAPVAAPAAPAEPPKAKLPTINAPMVGTFYRAPSPESPAFAEAGDVVKPGQTVCIIEAMKLMNELEAEIGGRVVRFLVENGDPVEFGQPLLELEPV